MTRVSISELKASPAKVISESLDFPVAVEKRNKTLAYLVGKDLYEKMITFLEDLLDKKAIKKTDFKKGRDFEQVAKELGV